MKILYVAAKYDYGIPARGYSFEHFNFYETLTGMGHEIVYFDFLSIFQQEGREGLSRKLLDAVDEHVPDLMFTFLFQDQFDPEVLRSITKRGKPVTFNWFADDHWRFDNFTKHWAPLFSFVSTTDIEALPKYRAIGYDRALLSQWAANPRIYQKKNLPPDCDVSFVGQSYGDRPSVMKRLSTSGIPVTVRGAGWNLRRWHAYARRARLLPARRLEAISNETRIDQEGMIELFNTSRINLNLSTSSQSGANQIKGRNFEIPACGGFQLTGKAARLGEFFVPDREIVSYDSVDDMIEKIRYYLSHDSERQAIADAGYARVMRDHTYERRFRALFHQMGLE
jgi:spore maturation protein CgeB